MLADSQPPAPPLQISPPLWSRRWWWHELRIALAINGLIGCAVAMLGDKPWDMAFLYTGLIGVSTQGLIECGRHQMAAHLARRRPDHAEAQAGWPGWTWMAPWVLISVIVGYLVGMALGDQISGTQQLHLLLHTRARVLSLPLIGSLMGSFALVYWVVLRHRLNRLALAHETAQRTAAEARLKLLEAQLEPHMLFNTLANLRVLISLNPPQALTLLDQLNGFLRATLNASRHPWHPLSQEMDRLQDYLGMMQVRMGERLRVHIDVPPALAHWPVPPLILQPLVENAIAHGLSPRREGGTLTIRAHLATTAGQAQLVLVVTDDGLGFETRTNQTEPPAPSRTSGVGLALVRERLRAQYGDLARLSLESQPGQGTQAQLYLPHPHTP